MAKKKLKDKNDFPSLGRWLLFTESEAVRKRAVLVLAVLCALLFFADFFHLRHGKFSMEDIPGFYGLAGFSAFTFIIFATKALKKLLNREPDYYGDTGTESEEHPDFDLDVKEHGDA